MTTIIATRKLAKDDITKSSQVQGVRKIIPIVRK
jgi:hypothetical protein